MLTATLYTKAGCTLCDNVKEVMSQLAPDYPHTLEEVDITQDPVLFERHRTTIPLVVIGRSELRAPISRADLLVALQKAANSAAFASKK